MASFLDFLQALANDEVVPDFTDQLISRPNQEDNFYFGIGDRWCSVERLLAGFPEAKALLHRFAFDRLDSGFSFSSGNLKAQYIPDEDFINEGSAIVLYSVVGGTWMHSVRIKNQLPKWERLLENIEG